VRSQQEAAVAPKIVIWRTLYVLQLIEDAAIPVTKTATLQPLVFRTMTPGELLEEATLAPEMAT
jgi:hypothetical protein